MHVSHVTYSQLVNTGNYENERFEVEVSVASDEDESLAWDTAIAQVRKQVSVRLKQLNAATIDESNIPY